MSATRRPTTTARKDTCGPVCPSSSAAWRPPSRGGPAGGSAGAGVRGGCARPLPRPPRSAAVLAYSDSLQPVREFAAAHAERSGLDPDRTADFVLAVAEVAANSLRHASGAGTAHI